MKLRRIVLLLGTLATLLVAAVPVLAQSAPPQPGDFVLNIVPGGAGPSGAMPDCTPSLPSLGALFMAGQASVTADCKDASSSKGASSSGTVSNPTLAASSGDAGFNTGTITMLCDTEQSTLMTLLITPTTSTMQRFGGTIFQACSFSMVFQDAKRSSLIGTVEVNGTLGDINQTVVDNIVDITIKASTYVTSGTGAFAGYTGSGLYVQTQQINVSPTQAGGAPAAAQPAEVTAFCTANGISPCSAQTVGAWCQANMSNPAAAQCATIAPLAKRSLRVTPSARATTNAMRLTLTRKAAGRARILSPAPAPGKPKAAAKVKATTKVRLTATKGSACTVRASTGAIIGKGVVKGKYGTVTISPKAGAYKGARSIVATCTRNGRTITSNAVRISLT